MIAFINLMLRVIPDGLELLRDNVKVTTYFGDFAIQFIQFILAQARFK